MEKIPEKMKNTFNYVYNDYIYNKDHRNSNIYRCNTRRTMQCCGAVRALSDGSIKLLNPHNHPVQECIGIQHLMIEEMKKLSRKTLIPFKQIFDDVCRKYPDAAAYCSFMKLRPMLHRQRANSKPSIPQSLEILYDQMKSYQPLKNLKICFVKSVKDETVVIITNDVLLEGLKKSKEIFVDGTFAVTHLLAIIRI